MSTNLALIREFYKRYLATGELPRDMVHEEIEVHDHDTPDQGTYWGVAGAERWLADWGEAWGDWSFDVEEFIDAGEAVVVVVRMHAMGKGSGAEVDRQDALVYRFADEKIVRTDYFNSKAQALEAAGVTD
jgi:ketosteroid isomerase-like protein